MDASIAKTLPSSLVRQQTSIIFWGSLIAFGPAAVWVIANVLGFQTPFVWSIFALVFAPFVAFPIAVTYAMLRYHLLDLDIVFTRGIVYTLLTLMVTVVYFLIVSLLGVLFQDSEISNNPLILVIFVVILIHPHVFILHV